MPYSTRELMARIIQCEAGGEGTNGMKAVASVIMNRATVTNGEFSRVSKGGNVRAIIEQKGQFNCMMTKIGSKNNKQNIYNMNPTNEHYQIADWALAGNTLNGVGNSLFFYNPYKKTCSTYFPTQVAKFYSRIGNHCFYAPTAKYKKT